MVQQFRWQGRGREDLGLVHFPRVCVLGRLHVFPARLNAGLSKWFAGREVRFDVPEKPLQLDADVTIAKDHIQICNRGAFPWSSVTLRVTSRVSMSGLPPELPLLGQVG